MSESQFEYPQLLEYLRQKWVGRPCQMCGQGNWDVQSRLFELRSFAGGSLLIGGGPVIPVIPITCTNCGNTVLLNAIIAGLVKRAEEAGSGQPDPKTLLTGRHRQG